MKTGLQSSSFAHRPVEVAPKHSPCSDSSSLVVRFELWNAHWSKNEDSALKKRTPYKRRRRQCRSNNTSIKMSDEHTIPPYAPNPSTESSPSKVLKGAAERVSEAIEIGRQPGMPLSVLAKVTREAPLAAVLCAFLLGVAVARRR
jgi:hypothetical protein